MDEDARARERALEPKCSFAVRAPAGSGKTTLLIRRVLKLLTTVEHPEQIVAITFTRKAAEEMRSRIVEALALAGNPVLQDEFERATAELAYAVLKHDQERDWGLMQQPGRLRIMTIDALCQSLVRQMPVTARFTGAPAVEDDASELYREAARLALAEVAGGAGSRHHTAVLLAHVDNDWRRLESLVATMLSRREQWLPLLQVGSEKAFLQQAFDRVVIEELNGLRALLDDVAVREWVGLARYAGENGSDGLSDFETLPTAEPVNVVLWQAMIDLLLTAQGEWRKQVTKKNGFPTGSDAAKAKKAAWADFVAALRERDGLLERLQAVRRLPPVMYGEWEWRIIAALVGLLRSAAAQLMVLTEASGRTDFSAISIAALQALGAPEEPTDLALHLDFQIHHLLIDEFQDTSGIQFELLLGLTGGWTPGDGRTLFLVGDPMQSIYRFRQAEVELFKRVLRDGRVGQVAVEQLTLTKNFRSQPKIVDWVNEVMPAALEIGGSEAGVFVAQTAVRTPGPEAVTVHAYSDYQADAEAEDVCRLVRDIRVDAPDCSIAVLVRIRTHLLAINRALLAAGIPVQTRDIEPLSDLPCIADLTALARALMHPGDRIGWLAVMRAPWVGLSLANLLRAVGSGDTIAAGVCELAAAMEPGEAEYERQLRAREVAELLLTLRAEYSLENALERAWVALDGPELLARSCADEQEFAVRLEDVRRFMSVVGELQRAAIVPTAERLETCLRDEFSTRPGSVENAVQIMTMHGAKGLEFDHVIIPGLGRRPRTQDRPLLIWSHELDVNDTHNLLLAPFPGREESPLYDFLRWRDARAQQQEAVRLLYVALTRAREQVHLLCHMKAKAEGEWEVERRALGALLWPYISTVLSTIQIDTSAPDLDEYAPALLTRISVCEPLPLDRPDISSEPAAAALLEFDWASQMAMRVGTVTHRVLQYLGRERVVVAGLEWNQACVSIAKAEFRSLGITGVPLEDGMALVRAAVMGTLDSERGRWLFSAEHREASAELALSCMVGSDAGRVVIDRTFVDNDGYRWIVDYKTGSHRGGDLDAWLDSERVRYEPQLARYGRIMHMHDDRPIMLGLYFPMVDGWRAWPFGTFNE
ncbi:MAG: UvrD-helicase domain-containing protein [Gammaproteobacteria bacterium]